MKHLLRIICCLAVVCLLSPAALADTSCAHSFAGWEDSGETHRAACTLCGETVEAAHTYEEYWTVDGEAHSHRCVYCGHAAEAEAHTWPEAWEADASGHYRLCTVCHTGGQSQDHSFGEAELVKWPLLYRTGRREQTCTVCGYRYGEAVPPLKTLRIVLFCLLGTAVLTAATVFTIRIIKNKRSQKENSRS